jgi:H+/Cl- antiporter ClcA
MRGRYKKRGKDCGYQRTLVIELQQDESGIVLMPKKSRRVLTKNCILILIGVVTSIFLSVVVPIILDSDPVQTLVSGNVTLLNFAEVTKQPMWYVFAPLAVLVIVGLVYLWIEAGKREGLPEIKKEIGKLTRAIKELEKTIKQSKALDSTTKKSDNYAQE